MRLSFVVAAVLLCGTLLCGTLRAVASEALPSPSGRVLLTVSGAIQQTNAGEEAHFDMAMLQALPQHTVTTHNPWAKGLHTYRGFSAVDLLARLESQGTRLQVTALNQYMTEIPLEDFTEQGAIFATHQDGKPMSLRNLGPIMVIYPFDQHEELKSEVFYGRSIWQIYRIKSVILKE
ncbi:hypothetical protein HGG82_06115 [Marinomonas sp. M1K-6]|uniref:Oxidoreductase molybdopterin-binding domain-containing protein n=1 Tax=Marinomonas profundi TaxID=2726122 RepID=A0A847RAD8_9GAMM|nr:molybdopterin-dependent oxidoreductase [Marinomonas profundi]NLQ17200.1 hypothetical protein [Marinomonas profundi]UDV04608.1 hypothetical protein J8N69_07655 [Marinomonas profundi]